MSASIVPLHRPTYIKGCGRQQRPSLARYGGPVPRPNTAHSLLPCAVPQLFRIMALADMQVASPVRDPTSSDLRRGSWGRINLGLMCLLKECISLSHNPLSNTVAGITKEEFVLFLLEMPSL